MTTTAVERLSWLNKEVDALVSRYQREAASYKKQAFRLKIVSVFLAAIITVLLGVKLGEDNAALMATLSNVALVLGALITVLSAYEAFFDPRALWVRETVTFARLKDLQRDLRYWASGLAPDEVDDAIVDSFKCRLSSILEDTLKYWMRIRGAGDIEKYLEARAELRKND